MTREGNIMLDQWSSWMARESNNKLDQWSS